MPKWNKMALSHLPSLALRSTITEFLLILVETKQAFEKSIALTAAKYNHILLFLTHEP